MRAPSVAPSEGDFMEVPSCERLPLGAGLEDTLRLPWEGFSIELPLEVDVEDSL